MRDDMQDGIHSFDPCLYPFMLYVGKEVGWDCMDKTFYSRNMAGQLFDFKDFANDNHASVASTYPVMHKADNAIGCFVNLVRPKLVTVGIIAHEASHVVDCMCDSFDLAGNGTDMFLNGEARAYLLEWAANCIHQVLKNKNTKDNGNSGKTKGAS